MELNHKKTFKKEIYGNKMIKKLKKAKFLYNQD